MRFLLLATPVPGIAGSANAQCDHELKIDIQVVAQPEPVVRPTPLHLAQIADLAKRSGFAVALADESRRVAQACGRDV
jgi:hypothetical protein